jgi:hypothetical protein
VRSLVWIPVVTAIVAAAVWAVMRSLIGRVPAIELVTAAGITGVAAELALIPMVLTRGASAGAVSQAGLVGTVVHMFLSILLAGGAYFMHLVPNRGSFLYFLMAFYWLTLVMVVMALVRAVRRADVLNKA